MLPDVDPENMLPPLTVYSIMKLGKVKLLPYFIPGDPAMGDAIRGLAGKRSAVMLANHGPVVAGKDLEDSVRVVVQHGEAPMQREQLGGGCWCGVADHVAELDRLRLV